MSLKTTNLSGVRSFVSNWHQRNLAVLDTNDLERILKTASHLPALADSFNAMALVRRANAELARRQQALAPPVALAFASPVAIEAPTRPRLIAYVGRGAYEASKPQPQA
ncbi:hypothetical protein [Hymenobacter lapidiphilus]|uniref:Uncharacterized protein n=1 Tax=Hymenobacter lapidiphilus TaxID=2608003 RepID=A0A7Y7PT10_9BACT|nr:hypothetical protein [Hymenobacter lapidiphilus]NVO33476.1 hypothetical protein [Hymenobacter lapidiphilus]